MYLYGVLLLCASSFLVGHNGTQEGIGVSREEELELEKQLELLNKPATNYGDTIDCVDFYKQPAFDHPLLKNHTFSYQMRPTSLPRRAKDQVSPKFAEPVTIGLKGGGCPVGTVPIRRITKEDLIRERLRSKIKSFEDNSLGTHYAVLRTTANSNKKFVGAGAQISTHNPHVDGRQYSAARVKIRNGPDSLETGWRDRANGNWWFISGSHHDEVGFWPKRIFTGLGDLANYAEWGGEAFSPLGTNPAPMGTGLIPVKIPKYNAYFCEVSVLNEYGQTVDVDNTEEFADDHKLYGVKDLGIGDSGRFVQYGGPSHVILKNY
ncbi:hypothetical protein C3L33_15790, partial [Rhododendron williamsianum]